MFIPFEQQSHFKVKQILFRNMPHIINRMNGTAKYQTQTSQYILGMILAMSQINNAGLPSLQEH
jgi:hypothetical protein